MSHWTRRGSHLEATTYGCGSKPMGPHFGVGAPPVSILVGIGMFTGYGLLTHGHMSRELLDPNNVNASQSTHGRLGQLTQGVTYSCAPRASWKPRRSQVQRESREGKHSGDHPKLKKEASSKSSAEASNANSPGSVDSTVPRLQTLTLAFPPLGEI